MLRSFSNPYLQSFAALLWVSASLSAQTVANTQVKPAPSFGQIALTFEANQGQDEPSVDALSRGPGYTLLLRQGTAQLSLTQRQSAEPDKTASVMMRLLGATHHAFISKENQVAAKANYLIGNDPSKWQLAVPNYERVRYHGVYPGIDLVYYGNHRNLEHDFVVSPGADPRLIRIALDGAKSVRLDVSSGDLVLATAAGDLRLKKPASYQKVGGQRREVSSRYQIASDGTVGFTLARYDHHATLVIDPELSYSTINDGASGSLAVDGSRCAYITGSRMIGAPAHAVVMIMKMDPGGSALAYITYFGGTTNDGGSAITIDQQQNIYVTGVTYSTDFPTVTPFQSSHSPSVTGLSFADAFITKLNPLGNKILYSSFLGGTNVEYPGGVAVDSQGRAYIAGTTTSSDFPTVGPLQSTLHGASNLFIAAVSSDGASLRYSTYLGGSGSDESRGIGIDAAGDAIVGGITNSTDFPVKGALQSTPKGSQETFIAKINPTGSALVYSTYLGGSDYDEIESVTADASGNAYAGGSTLSLDFPTFNALQPTVPNTGVNSYAANLAAYAFVTKVNPTGSAFVYSTYLGDDGNIPNDWYLHSNFDHGNQAFGVTVDAAGDAYVTGYTYALNFPVTSDAFQPQNNGYISDCASNAFITRYSPGGDSLLYSTYFGGASAGHDGSGVAICDGSGGAVAYGIALDPLGNFYISGTAGWPNKGFPLTGGAYKYQTSDGNPFLAKFAVVPMTSTTTLLTASTNPQGVGQPIAFVATVKTSLGAAETTGQVFFALDGIHTATVNLSAAGTAVWIASTLSSGNHQVSANYSGSITIHASASSVAEVIATTTAPVISPVAGTYNKAITVTLKPPATTASMYYTTNGSNPTPTSTPYTAPLLVNKSLTIKAIATMPGRATSKIASAAYVIDPPAAPPTFTPPAGIFPTPLSVTLLDATPSAAIHYTINGTTPTTASARYSSPIAVKASETIKAIAIAPGFQASAVATAAYLIKTPAATPVISPPAGHYTTPQMITISDATHGANIYFTLNGTEPTTSSPRYVGSFRVTRALTIKAIAIANGYLQSAVATDAYTIP